jgi:hypothetical protein
VVISERVLKAVPDFAYISDDYDDDYIDAVPDFAFA